MKKIYASFLFFAIVNYCCAQSDLVDGYTDKLSYRAGESVIFYTKSVPNSIITSFELKDISGSSLVPSVTISGFTPNNQSGKPCSISEPWKNGWGYAPTCFTWTVPANLRSGYYMLDGKIPIIIKGDNSNDPLTGADIVIVCPTNTINAYTDYSTALTASSPCTQYSLYDVSQPITTVSFLRPQNRVRYSNCDDAFLDWISIWAANHNPVYHLNFISDADLDDINTGWDEITNAKLIIIPGHSEYWTRQARINFDRFVDAGKNALILSGNTMWCQVRLEIDPNNSANRQIVCYRGANWCTPPNVSGSCYSMDNTTDPLLGTYPWMSTDLKYSVLGSIGSDILRGGQSNFTYNGQKIIVPGSPLLNVLGVPISLPSTSGFPYIPNSFSNTEYDGTLVKCDADGNAILVSGEPELDLAALGFYQGEIIGYEFGTPDASPNNHHQFDDPNPNNNNQHYFPFMVFKKTYTSGTIVNVNSNRWCEEDTYGWTGTTPYRANITANIINLMINDYNGSKNGELLFTNVVPNSNNPGPGFISVKPAYTTVNYSACLDGNIHFTPHGIYLDHAYKVDNGFTSNPDHTYQSGPLQTRYIDNVNKFASAIVDANCSIYHALRIAQTANNENKENEIIQMDDLNFSLFPNPTTGKFILQVLSSDNSEKNIYIFNSIYQEIYHEERTLEQSIDIDLSVHTKGIYFVKVVEGNNVVTEKIVIM